jgi:non-specific serine/threonine protein kinase
VERRAGNLPAEMTRFIGRERELSAVSRLLRASRLVTLAGPGGVGKTRLALRAAAGLGGRFADGVWFVELSALHEVDLLAHAIAETIQLPDQSSRDRLDVLADHLEDKQLLLILDTCEHMVDACAMLSEVLLRAAARLRILVTSREPLGVMGEHVLTIAPLTVPDADGPVEETARSEAVMLFMDRATAILPSFVASEHDLAEVARLCRRLDGIPLAIELAAVRLRTLSLEQIASRLDDRFRLLGTARQPRNRHQTLRAAVGWSHDLCTPEERLLWARLSVFPGGFDLDAAENICGGDGLQVMDTLSRLVEKSVVMREGRDRYRMLDTLRDYGMERLAAEPAAERELRARHREWYAALADRMEAATLTPGQPGRFARLRSERANLRAALDHAMREGGAADTQRMAVALAHFWFAGGRFSEGRHWLERALALPDPEPGPARTIALCACGLFAGMQGDLERAEELRAEADVLAARLGHPRGIMHTRRLGGLIAFLRDDFDTARELLEKPREGEEPDAWATLTLPLLGALYCITGELDAALLITDRCLEISEARGDLWCRSYATWVRALACCLRGDPDAARADATHALKLMQALHDRLGSVMAVDLLAGCAYFSRQPVRAARLFGAADRIWRTLGAPMLFGRTYLSLRDMIVGEVKSALGERRWLVVHDEGARMDLDEAVRHALEDVLPPAADPWAPLTRREREIAELIAEGLSNREIAERLVIAKRTADSHVEHILAKLGFNSRTQIATWTVSRHEQARARDRREDS